MLYPSLADMFVSQAKRYGNRILYRFSRDGEWDSCTWTEALDRVREIALGLISLGVQKGDHVAIFSTNRLEWSLIDWANICIGALTVPIYASSSPYQVGYILNHSKATVLFAESVERLTKLNPHDPSLRSVSKFILLDSGEQIRSEVIEPARVLGLGELQDIGRHYGETHESEFDRRVKSLRPEDNLTIIYTSGTTGEPKGVLTTHGHYLFMIEAVRAALPSGDEDVNLQFLPFAHSFGRLEHFMVVAQGYTCGFARSLETIAKDLLVIRPTLLFSVPRLYENAYGKIRARVAMASSFQRSFFRWAVGIGQRFSLYQTRGQRVPWLIQLQRSVANKLVFSKIHSSFGGRLRLAISGGAPLAPEIASFFHALNILILEGYGLTETSTVSHVNRVDRYKFGTVGLPLDGVECRIAPDGEILLRGANILKEYYADPETTREVIDPEGWFHTGDIGEVDADGFLRITDRKKDLIVTSGGKKIAPQVIENLLKADPLISQALVFGDRQAHLMALITLRHAEIADWAKSEGLEFESPEQMASHPRVLALMRERIRHVNRGLAPYEAVRSFRILPHDFRVDKEELTPTLKLRRQVVMNRYQELIEGMVHKPQFEL